MLDHMSLLFRFRSIVEAGSVSRAAEALNVTQPALSRSLSMLEAHYGRPLVDRHARGVEPTAFGKRLMSQVARLDREWERAEAALASDEPDFRGSLRIDAGPVWSAVVLPRVLTQLQRAHPNINFEVRAHQPDNYVRRLNEGVTDVCFSGFPPPDTSDGLIRHEFVVVRDRIVARESHPIFGKLRLDGTIDARHVINYPWVVYTRDPLYESETIHAVTEGTGEVPRVAIKSESLLSILELLRDSDSLAILPDAAIIGRSSSNIVPVPVPIGRRRTPSGATYHAGLSEWPPLIELLKLCAAQISMSQIHNPAN